MPKIFKPAVSVFAATLAGLMLAGPAQAQSTAGLQDEILQLKGRVAKLEDSSGGGCSLDPKKFLKVKCPKTSLQIGGRIMLDAAWFTNKNIGGDSGHEFRRARLFAKGSFAKTWGWKAQFDFAGAGTAGKEVSTKDLYIEYQGLKKSFNNLVIRAGHYKVPFMLQNLTSSKYIPFMERSQAYDWSGAIGADRKTGLGFMMGGGNYSLAGGVFAGKASETAFKYGTTLAGRATFAPIASKTEVVHIGGGLVYRKGFKEGKLTLESRPEIHLAKKPISTGEITDAKSALSYNAELAGVYGPFSLQGEYIRTKLDRKTAASKDLNFSTFYVEATWWLTGESRNYSAKKGAFGRVKPKADLSDGGPGAWMVGYRISRAVLEDEDINGGHQNVHTAGVTWKPNPYVALKVNGHLAHGHKKDSATTNKFADRGVQMRVQVDF